MHRIVFALAVMAPLALGHAANLEAQRPFDTPLVSLADLVDIVKSAVVNVEVVARVGGRDADERFFGREQLKQGAGSGFIVRPDGLIVTNNHVVAGATTIRVRLDDGRTFPARILGRDPLTDVALIHIEGEVKNLPAVKLGDSDGMRVGDAVVAIGNPFGLASSVSAGILSAKARVIGAGPYDDFLQTDAAINPGNSGGPLFNARGEVIGMNTAIVGGGTGIGFAVPASLIRSLMPQLEKGAVTRGFLGVAVQDLTPELAKGLGVQAQKGALVSSVSADAPAKKAGLRVDDAIVEVDGEAIDSSGALTRKVALKAPGTVALLTVNRGTARLTLAVTLGTRPNLERVAGDDRPQRGERTDEKWGLNVQATPDGVGIVAVAPGSPADQAGLEPGMVVVEAGGSPVRSVEELQRALERGRRGDVVLLRVQRGELRALRALTVP
ncbi:MAG: trypsin-like peptidase domain-containing protein [Myxococcaceae bacterium]|nr:trypsin-like peptidase domain-containing protein [Myxococcaceae bacterium]